MPTYLRDVVSLPNKLISTIRLYNSLIEAPELADEKIAELLEFSSKIIYLETGNKNRYFMIEEPV